MLTDDQFNILVDPIVKLYEEYSQTVIKDIAKRLVGTDISSTAAWQLERLTESGLVYEKALEELSQLTGISERQLNRAFQKAGVQTLKFDDSIYKAAGLDPIPLNLSPAMVDVLKVGIARTQGIIRNFTLTTALSGQQSYIAALDLAYLQVSSGAMSYDQAIKLAVKSVSKNGLSVVQFARRSDYLDVAVRRSVLTGVAQTAGQLQIVRADQMGQDLVQTSAHIGARPSHAEWQGQVFSRAGTSDKYPSFIENTRYGSGDGLGGWNCRHSFFPYFEGLSQEAYSRADVREINKETVLYNGKEMSVYEATKQQRAFERSVRQWKREASALKAANLPRGEELAKVREYQGKLRQLVAQTGLKRQYSREGGRWLAEF